ncbi:MAG TPA: hypothetical protein VLT87_21960 [Thermoanaerobaculia bacterium]|nr:hypothetical protein [Thermoanaerobaculia bacterium]
MAYPVIPIVWLLAWLIGKVVRARREKVRAASAPSRSRGVPWFEKHLTKTHYAYLVAGSVAGTVAVVVSASVNPDLGCSTFVALSLVPYCSLIALPHWLAWRVLGPAGRTRAGYNLLRIALHPSKASREGALGLFAVTHGLPEDLRWSSWAIPWTAFALAVKAESENDPARADTVLAVLAGESPLRLPRRVRSQGVEILAWAAARRGDWEGVLRRTESGRGRGVRLLRRLAAAHTGQGGFAPLLWLFWLLAPERKKTLPFVRAAGVKEPVFRESPAPLPSLERGPWLFHLHLLANAADGRPVPAHAVEQLAAAWEEPLDAASQARLAARGLELGVREPAGVVGTLRETVLAEIQSLTEIAQGPWDVEDGDGLLADLHRRRIDHLYDELDLAMEGFPEEGGMSRDFGPPLSELERWLLLRGAAERLEAEAGFDALVTAWHNGLGIAACNWPVYLERRYGEQAIWACYVMHLWCTEQAARIGDEGLAALSRENAWIAASKLGKVR